MIALIVWTVLYPTCLPLITCSLISAFMWRDFAGILLGLFNKFKIDRFLSVLLDSLVDYRWEANFDSLNSHGHLLFPSYFSQTYVRLLQFVWWILPACIDLHIRDSSFQEFCSSCCSQGSIFLLAKFTRNWKFNIIFIRFVLINLFMHSIQVDIFIFVPFVWTFLF